MARINFFRLPWGLIFSQSQLSGHDAAADPALQRSTVRAFSESLWLGSCELLGAASESPQLTR